MGSIALTSLFQAESLLRKAKDAKAQKWPGVVSPLHHPAKVKRVIYLYMAGGASHLETFDYKPKLAEMNGKPMPESFTKGQPIAGSSARSSIASGRSIRSRNAASPDRRSQRSFPKLAEVADDLCIIRSLKTEAINHDPAHTFMNTGTTISGRPSMGSWLWYGLGSESDNLAGLRRPHLDRGFGQQQPIAQRQWRRTAFCSNTMLEHRT